MTVFRKPDPPSPLGPPHRTRGSKVGEPNPLFLISSGQPTRDKHAKLRGSLRIGLQPSTGIIPAPPSPNPFAGRVPSSSLLVETTLLSVNQCLALAPTPGIPSPRTYVMEHCAEPHERSVIDPVLPCPLANCGAQAENHNAGGPDWQTDKTSTSMPVGRGRSTAFPGAR